MIAATNISSLMKTKNIYIIYPQGYGGNYMSWAIDISDADLYSVTIKNPINLVPSPGYGGEGTSHLHTRIPTHQGFSRHLAWIARNRPTEAKTYLVNSGDNAASVICTLMQQDPTGVFINIHANNDRLVESYAEINAVIKWPTAYLTGYANYDRKHIAGTDLFNCADNIDFRNFLIRNHGYNDITNTPVNYSKLDNQLQTWYDWAVARSAVQPHEVNSDTYLMEQLSYENRIFEICCKDIASPKLIEFITDFAIRSGAINRFDNSYLSEFHHQYIAAQSALRWFSSISNWYESGEIDEYLTSHSVIQAQFIKELFCRAGVGMIHYNVRRLWHTNFDWIRQTTKILNLESSQAALTDELPDFYFDSNINTNSAVERVVASGAWKAMSVHELNTIFYKGLQ